MRAGLQAPPGLLHLLERELVDVNLDLARARRLGQTPVGLSLDFRRRREVPCDP
jgi:hypothetical protein